MKKIFLAIVAMAVSLTVSAQVNFGFRCGLNMSDVNGEGTLWDNLTGSSQSGFFLGPTVKIVPLGFIGVDLSAIYEQRETEVSDITLKQQAFAVPVNLRVQLLHGYSVTLTAFAGPQFNFNLSCDKNQELREKIGEWEWKESNLSGNLGVAVMLFEHVEFNASYNFALGKAGDFNKNVWDKAKANIKGKKFNGWRIGVACYF